MKLKSTMRVALAGMVLAVLGILQPAHAFNHPGIPLSQNDLDYVKARLTVQPWKAGWDALQADPQASLNYTMQGPFVTVSRTPDLNQNPWKSDMEAVYKLALRGYYSGDATYSAKATAIFDAWATTMTSYAGNENYLDIGDLAPQLFGGPEILRSTYSGWTATNTAHAVNYFNTAIKPALFVPSPLRGANQGMEALRSAMGLAVFCDDTTYWNQCLFAWRNDPEAILDTAPLGMVGDTGRDQPHALGQYQDLVWSASVAWSQGVDLFSEHDNRLATCAEYSSKYNLYNVPPYATFGSLYGMYSTIGSAGRGRDLTVENMITRAYEVRKGMSLPWTDRMSAVWGNDSGFEFLKLADTSTATYAPLTFPEPAPMTAGAWTDADIGSPGQAGSSSYANGVWTVKGGGADVYYSGSNSDQFHFAYQAMTSDFTFTARVTGISGGGTNPKVGLMVRSALTGTANNADVYMTPTSVEAEARGALAVSHGDFIRTFTQTLPYWIKVERRGEWIGRFCSPDGINWQPMNYAQTTMTAGTTVYVGLMACANNNSLETTATMDNVAISAASGSGVAPLPPTSLAGAAGRSQAMLSWVPGAGSVYCNVKRATVSGGPYTTIAANVPAATYTDLDLANGSTYYYVVSDVNSVGESSNTAQVSVTPSATAAVPAAPTGVTSFAYDGAVDLSWSAVPGAVTYNVKRSTTSGGPYTRVFYGQDRELTSFTDMDPIDGTTYYYVVTAVNAWGESVNSAPATATPQVALVWTGALSGIWDVNTTANWTRSGAASVYTNGQPVQFDDSAFATSISPSTTMTPSSVLINNSTNTYTIGTTGIGGTAKVVKRGSGALSIYAAQPFSGGMTIGESCTINFYNGATIGTGIVAINADCNFWATSSGGNWAGTLPSGFSISDGTTLTYGGDWKIAFNGNLTGSGTLKLAPGTHATFMTMSGNNSAFNGTVTIGGGRALTLNTVNSGSANAIWNLTAAGNQLGANVSGGTFYLGELTGDLGTVFNNSTATANTATFVLGNDNTEDTPVFNGLIVDNGNGMLAITKVGANTQTLGGANTYSGATTITAGTLNLTGSLSGTGTVTVNNGGTLAGTGSIAGATTIANGGTVAPGDGGIGTLTLSGGLTLAGGSAINLEVGATSDALALTGGTYTAPASGTVAINLTTLSGLAAGTYPLITGATGINAGSFTLAGSLPVGFAATLGAANGTLSLVVIVPPAAPAGLAAAVGNQTAYLNWTSSGDATSYNIKRSTVSGSGYTTLATGLTTPAYASTGLANGVTSYYVVSGVNAAGEGINSSEVSATPIGTSGWASAPTSGNWSLPANWGGVVLTTGATLTFNTSSTTALTNDLTNLSLGGLLFNSGASAYSLNGNALALTGNITNNSTSSQTLGLPLVLQGNATVTSNTGTIFLSGVIGESGGSWGLTKAGAGTLNLSAANTFTGGFTMGGNGLVDITGNGSRIFGTGLITLNNTAVGSTAHLYWHNTAIGTLTNNFFIAPGSTNLIVQSSSSGSANFAGSFSGSGTIQFQNGFSPTFSFTGDLTPFAGIFQVGSTNQTLTVSLTNTTTVGLPNATLAITPTGTGADIVQWNPSGTTSATIPLGALSSTTTSSAATPVILRNAKAGTTATWQVGALNTNTTFGGVIQNGTGTSALTKTGTASLTLSGPSTYSGPTTISAGTLNLTGSLSGTGTVAVNSGGTLSGTGSIAGVTTVASGGTVAPGNGGIGTLTLSGGLTLAGGSALNVQIGTIPDTLALTGGTYNGPASGTVAINLTTLSGFAAGTYPLITGAAGISAASFTLAGSLPGGFVATLNATNGTLSIVVMVLPGTPAGLTATVASSSQVNLSWSAASGSTSYNVKRATVSGGAYTTIASGVTSTSFANTGLTSGTTYYYVVSAVNAAGESANSLQISAVPTANTALPRYLLNADIGTTGATGSSSFASGVYTMTAARADIWGTADGFQFLYQPISGDCDIRARVVSLTNTNGWAKAGVMVRETLAANSTYATTFLSPSNGVAFQQRATTGASATSVVGTSGLGAPCWVRLVRSGNTFTSFYSADGATWTTQGTTTITMGTSVYVGLVACSHVSGTLLTGTFDNVSLFSMPSPWSSSDIGTVGAAGSAKVIGGVYTLTGSGADIGGTADAFRYAYQSASGDCDITTRVTDVSGTGAWAKAGVMIRETLNANSTYTLAFLSPANGVAFQQRNGTGASASTIATLSGLGAPQWLRLTRVGNVFTASYSANGTNWTSMGSTTIAMAANVYIGLPVCSTVDGKLCTATLDNVTVTP